MISRAWKRTLKKLFIGAGTVLLFASIWFAFSALIAVILLWTGLTNMDIILGIAIPVPIITLILAVIVTVLHNDSKEEVEDENKNLLKTIKG